MAYLGENIKKLGFGLMRLPVKDGAIDIAETSEMTDMFLADGFTYFDTAWAYPGSEDAIRQALVMRYPREKYVLATKNAAWLKCRNKKDAVMQFETSLRQTQAGYFDFYLLHNLGESRTHFFDDFGLWDWALETKERGLIKHLGFSFHSTPEELENILTAHPEAEFVQLQINYADWENPLVRSRECYETARRHGKPVVIMEPVRGGMLASPPPAVAEILKAADPDMSAASWAIRYAASLDGIITVLSGMSNSAQMADNLSYMKNFKKLSDEQLAVIERAREEIKKIPVIPCTSCNYCAKVCPMNIGVSGTLNAMNDYILFNNLPYAKSQIDWLVDSHGKARADKCIKCGKCEQACPQHIHIRDELARTVGSLGIKTE